MFGKRKKASEAAAAVFDDLRQQVLTLDPVNAGLEGETGTADPWGFMMETGYSGAVATLVCLRDGTTSLYTSSGFGIIGGGFHESVVAANRQLFTVLRAAVGDLTPSEDTSLPDPGMTVLRALAVAGHRSYTTQEDELGEGRDRFSPVFYAAQDVITELRIIDERS